MTRARAAPLARSHRSPRTDDPRSGSRIYGRLLGRRWRGLRCQAKQLAYRDRGQAWCSDRGHRWHAVGSELDANLRRHTRLVPAAELADLVIISTIAATMDIAVVSDVMMTLDHGGVEQRARSRIANVTHLGLVAHRQHAARDEPQRDQRSAGPHGCTSNSSNVQMLCIRHRMWFGTGCRSKSRQR
jgi:hypothetical protein